MGLFSKIKEFFSTPSQDKKLILPSCWTQKELNDYFKSGLDLFYDFIYKHSPNKGIGEACIAIVQIYQSIILENEFKVSGINDYSEQDIRTFGLLYGLDQLYNKEKYLKFINKSDVNKDLLKNSLCVGRIENKISKMSRYISEFILAFTINKKASVKDMINNPQIDIFFNRYLLDCNVINRNDSIVELGIKMEMYANQIRYSLDYLYKKMQDINYNNE
ncbi:MAG: hypothetical protein E7353_08415 [Clostridiales bacterium]|nr:hypothetical protein [Clostridiales bacterium]